MLGNLFKTLFYSGGEISFVRLSIAALTTTFIVTWFINRRRSVAKFHRVSRSLVPVKAVSPGNPCPVLRSLVAQGVLNESTEGIHYTAEVLSRLVASGEGSLSIKVPTVAFIGSIANGYHPSRVFQAWAGDGLHINRLRLGPLFKNGVSSNIINTDGTINEKELARLEEYASEKVGADGKKELGIDMKELKKFMDDNFERASDNPLRRRIDRPLMEGEWPTLVKAMGVVGSNGKRYLRISETRTLFLERRFPQRMMDRFLPKHD